MKYYSTELEVPEVDLKTAVLDSLPADKGLYLPEDMTVMPQAFYNNLKNLSLREVASAVAAAMLGDDIEMNDLMQMVHEAINFDAPLVKLDEKNYVLELFHGPTLAFKDFGARFMARLMQYFIKGSDRKLTVLVATSGDTGSAVANGFLNVDGIEVIILYPSGKVSEIQEKQLTTLGGNITALEIDGSFDDCQSLVKTAFLDEDLRTKYQLTSANSINIARLIPQTFYYFYACGQLQKLGITDTPVISIPSGNVGNLTAGLIAKRMGLPVKHFIASCNANDVLPDYLESGEYEPKETRHTISNAMDVGNPSNFARIHALYGYIIDFLKQDLRSWSYSDDETRSAIKEVYDKYDYILDPHGAVGYCGSKSYHENEDKDAVCITVETAHPAKFIETVEPVIAKKIELPERLAQCVDKEKKAIQLSSEYNGFKTWLLKR